MQLFAKNRTVEYTPWEFAEWSEIFEKAELRLNKERVYTLIQYLGLSFGNEGDIIEMGVYKGCTSYVMGEFIRRSGCDKTFYLCDTFEGTPSGYDKEKGDINRAGKYADTSVEYVSSKMKQSYLKCSFVKGFIPDSLVEIDDRSFCFAHVHLNLYESTRNALLWLNSHMTDCGITIVEDYGIRDCKGVRRAVDEFVEQGLLRKVYLPTGQAVIHFNH